MAGSALDDVVYRGDVRLAGIDPERRKDRQKRRPEGLERLLGLPDVEHLDLAVGLEGDVGEPAGFLTARRLKPEGYDRFRQVWEPDEWPAGFLRAYHLRNPQDEDQVISFGLFEGTMEDYRALRADPAASQVEDRRQREMAEVVDSVLLDGVFEVIEEVVPPHRRG